MTPRPKRQRISSHGYLGLYGLLLVPLLIFLLATLGSTSVQQQRIWDRLAPAVVLVVDGTGPESPMVFSGFMNLWEEVTPDGLRAAAMSDFEARNLSLKTILAFAVEWKLTGSWGQEEYPAVQYEDCFFALDVIPPAGTIRFHLPPAREALHVGFDTSAPKQRPQAVAYVRYVQFTDGSEFGTRVHAEPVFATRDGILRQLRRLDRAFRQGGGEAFIEELNDPIEPKVVDMFFNSIRTTLEKKGVEAAVGQVHNALSLARKHQDALDGQQD